MARGKQPPVTHALPKQRTLLDCFLEAQAEREKRRLSREQGADGQAAGQAGGEHHSGDQGLADRATIDAADQAKVVRDLS